MYEMPMWFDLPLNRTYDFKGATHVACKTTRKDKLKYTVVLSAMADGTKLKPVIVFKEQKKTC